MRPQPIKTFTKLSGLKSVDWYLLCLPVIPQQIMLWTGKFHIFSHFHKYGKKLNCSYLVYHFLLSTRTWFPSEKLWFEQSRRSVVANSNLNTKSGFEKYHTFFEGYKIWSNLPLSLKRLKIVFIFFQKSNVRIGERFSLFFKFKNFVLSVYVYGKSKIKVSRVGSEIFQVFREETKSSAY